MLLLLSWWILLFIWLYRYLWILSACCRLHNDIRYLFSCIVIIIAISIKTRYYLTSCVSITADWSATLQVIDLVLLLVTNIWCIYTKWFHNHSTTVISTIALLQTILLLLLGIISVWIIKSWSRCILKM